MVGWQVGSQIGKGHTSPLEQPDPPRNIVNLFIGQLVGIDQQFRIDHLCGFLNHLDLNIFGKLEAQLSSGSFWIIDQYFHKSLFFFRFFANLLLLPFAKKA